MSRRREHPLRELTETERTELEHVARSSSAPAEPVRRAQLILMVEHGMDYLAAARQVGRRKGDGVSALVARFNMEGLDALIPGHGGGPPRRYGEAERERIVREIERQPTCTTDGTASWSLSTLQRALRSVPDGLPKVSRDTIRVVMLEQGYSWQQSRSWCKTGEVIRRRQAGSVVVQDEDSAVKKN